MTLTISNKANFLSQKPNVEPQIILKIDDIQEGGIQLLFGAISVEKLLRYGNQEGTEYGDDSDSVYGGVIPDKGSRPWIMLSGSTTRFSHQIEPTKEGGTSIQQIVIKLVDKDQNVSRLFSPGNIVPDILSKRAQVYIMFKGGSFPDDAIRVMSGVVTQTEFGPGHCLVTVAHPEHLKRDDIFVKSTTKLDGAINNSQTTITVDSTEGFIEPHDILRSFIRIEDELIEYTGLTSTQFTGCTRGSLTTIALAHDNNTETTSVYRLESKPIQLALKLMLSAPDVPYWFDDEDATQFYQVTATETVDNGIFFPNDLLESEAGIVVGDFMSIEGSASNDFADKEITDIFNLGSGTVIVVTGVTVVLEQDSAAKAKFKSKYNVLPSGTRLDPTLVDVPRHELWDELFPTSFPTMVFLLHDTMKVKDFINKELYFVNSLYPVPRDGKASVQYTIPPLVEEDAIRIGYDNVIDPDKITIKRSTNFNFYNSIVYKFNPDVLDDSKFLAGEVVYSARSTNRIKTVNKPLVVESKGFQDNPDTRNTIGRITRRFLDRYQFAAQDTTVSVLFKDGFKAEVGDIIIFGDENLKITDIEKGDRNYRPNLMEIINKEMDIARGSVTLKLLSSEFGLDARYGVISPSSDIDITSPKLTTSRIPILKSYSTTVNDLEKSKWEQYITEKIEIHNLDFSLSEIVVLKKFDDQDNNIMVIEPALSFSPTGELFFVNAPRYPDADTSVETQAVWKKLHCFQMFQDSVVSGASNTVFDVANPGRFFVGSFVRVHDVDFTNDSTPDESQDDAEVTDITGSTLTVNRSLGFTPDNTMKVELIGFADKGKPYRSI